jgi:hypothetical protein
MQDRRRQFDEIFLQRTAGPYIGVKLGNRLRFMSLPFCPRDRTFYGAFGMSQKGPQQTTAFAPLNVRLPLKQRRAGAFAIRVAVESEVVP